MPTFVPLGGDLVWNLVAGLIGNNVVDAFAVSDANGVTGKLLRHLIGPAFDEFKNLTNMNAVAASSTAMNAVAASATAMNAVAASATARNAIRNSSTAFNIVAGSNIAIGKFVAGEVGLNPADYADMNAVAASATAMEAVAASATAMNAVAASATAMNAVAASATALKAICMRVTAADAVKAAIQAYRATIISTLDAATNLFNKSTITYRTTRGSNKLCSDALNTNTIIIPRVSPDQDLDSKWILSITLTRELFYGTDSTYRIWYNTSTASTAIDESITISSGVSMRGIYYKQSYANANMDPAVTCDVYTVI